MSYVPNGIALFRKGGRIIQEGAENIDLNAETIDGKIHFTPCLELYFSVKAMSSIKVKRELERSLTLNHSNTNLLACLPFDKPTERYGPHRYSNVHGKIVSCFMENRDISALSLSFLRLLLRQNLNSIPFSAESTEQIVPFWTGSYKRLKLQFRL